MTSNNAGSSRSRQSFLSSIPMKELKLIRVAVRRNNITTSVSPGPIERSIDDPKNLVPLVHMKKDDSRRSRGIFNRDDILVNQESQEPSTSVTYGRSLSGTPRAGSSPKSRSRSPDKDRRKATGREKDPEGDKRDADKERWREKERSPERDRGYRGRAYSRERAEARYRRRSLTPLRPGEYRPTHVEQRRRSGSRGREPTRDRYRRSRSHSVDYHKPSTSRKPSRSPHKRSVSPYRDRERQKSPRYDHSKSRRSRSPPKPNKPIHVEKRVREPSPPYRESSKRRSRSPYRYERERRRSRSPRYVESSRSRGSPSRYERYPPRRHSRSPGRHDGRRPSPDGRCKSPHPPIITFDTGRKDHRRSSRSPGYDRDKSYRKHRRSMSRSPRKRRSRSPRDDRETEYAFYEGIPGSEYWIPGPIRPGFPAIPRFYPPAFFPRIPGGPIIIPPRMPMVAPYLAPYRQRLPIYNSKQKPRAANPGPSGGEGASPAAGGGEETNRSGNGQGGEASVSIQEVSDSDSRKSDSKNPDEESQEGVHEKD